MTVMSYNDEQHCINFPDAPSFASTSATAMDAATPNIVLLNASPMSTDEPSYKEVTLSMLNNSLDVIAKHLAGIKNEMKELRETQNNILMRLSLPSTSSTSVSLPPEIKIPCNQIEDFENLNIWLSTNKDHEQILINYLSYMGGNTLAAIIRRMLERIFTNTLALKCNWTGRNNKIALKEYRVIQVIKCAVRRHKLAETATDSDIFAILSNWFRYTKDRNGGRERRRTMLS